MTLTISAEVVAEAAAETAVKADRSGQLDPQVIEAIRGAGFARHFVDREYGGNEGGFTEALSAISFLGQACTSAAWIASIAAYSSRLAGYLPEEGRRTVWADGPDTLFAGALVPSGQATATPGGWKLSGAWPYTSGAASAEWGLVCVKPANESSPARFFAVRLAEAKIIESWDVVGLRGTASHTLVLEDVFVPEYLVFDRDTAAEGRGRPARGAPHSIPMRAISGLTFAAPLLGAARGALHDTWSPGDAQDADWARAHAKIDAAGLLLHRSAVAADTAEVSPAKTALALRDAAFSAELCREAVASLVNLAGTSAMASGEALQRRWRDVTVGSTHVALRFSTASNAFRNGVVVPE